jgi:hypothetical protein
MISQASLGRRLQLPRSSLWCKSIAGDDLQFGEDDIRQPIDETSSARRAATVGSLLDRLGGFEFEDKSEFGGHLDV